ncbi:MAG: DUF2807 domain-containing protein [Flavobacteriaceae bacterium]|nr:DUF2807 domain-containing protein [Flavobacteriaceae bacterium]
MKKLIICTILFFLCASPASYGQSKEYPVGPFDKVIVSPYIQVIFKKGEKTSVVLENITVSQNKLFVEVSNNTLHLYLEGAKTIPKNEKVKHGNTKTKSPIYNNTTAKMTVTYQDLRALSLRGEEKFIFEDPLAAVEFKLSLYGEIELDIPKVTFDRLDMDLYGENELEIKTGKINDNKITSYGENEIEMIGVESDHANITSYGDAEIALFVNKEIKLTAYGETHIDFKGQALIKKGIVIGETTVKQIN